MPSNTPKMIWSSIERYYDEHPNIVEENEIVLDKKKKNDFIKTFTNLYNQIKTNYMKDEVKELDHHKQAAILIYSAMANTIIYSTKHQNIKYGNSPKETRKLSGIQDVFIELEKIALKSGLEYMRQDLNKTLSNLKMQEISEYSFPTPMSCNNDYFLVLTRQLFYDFHYGKIDNPEVYILSLANVLFLIESITLIENGIDIKELKKHINQNVLCKSDTHN